MSARTLAAALGVAVLTTGLLSMGVTVQAAESPGIVPAPAKVRAQIVRDIKDIPNVARCYTPVLAKSDPDYALLQVNRSEKSCNVYYNIWPALERVKGKWTNLNLPPSPTCGLYRNILVNSLKAPVSVYRDFKAAGFCN